ncbi:MAG: L-aspartate oxidase [Victivallaceae bacterium]|nr:L-aspartate oxidase [Victivallaceae bacterium]
MKKEKNSAVLHFDHIVVGSGLAGLSSALQLGRSGRKVAVVTKRATDECNSKLAQGGVACVIDALDTFDEHVRDTLVAGAGLCDEKAVREIVEHGPAAIDDMISLGTEFTTRGELGYQDDRNAFDLGREGGHHKRRILHAGDITGAELERVMIEAVRSLPNVQIFEYHIAIDLVMSGRVAPGTPARCLGVYVLDIRGGTVTTMLAPTTVLATGGAGKVYLYTSNPDVACGSGVAMAYRAGAKIANMEFIQFHPTVLYHPQVRSFLISEALRGEGAVLKCRYSRGAEPVEFMQKYHPMKSLAPRDVVARAIDAEMKATGEDCVYLDIRHLSEDALRRRFPNIFEKCLSAGINMAHDLIPVVPAAHFVCGGIKTSITGQSSIGGLYAVGETACTGLHGANRLASNSLLEAMVVPRLAAQEIDRDFDKLQAAYPGDQAALNWHCGDATDSDELVLISHNWDEIRRFMWDYVGIYRNDKRLERAKDRIVMIQKEIDKYYRDFYVTADLIELRNIATVAELIIDSARSRRESRGAHFTADHPAPDPWLECVDTVIVRGKPIFYEKNRS